MDKILFSFNFSFGIFKMFGFCIKFIFFVQDYILVCARQLFFYMLLFCMYEIMLCVRVRSSYMQFWFFVGSFEVQSVVCFCILFVLGRVVVGYFFVCVLLELVFFRGRGRFRSVFRRDGCFGVWGCSVLELGFCFWIRGGWDFCMLILSM